jgi:hypothetical protein
MYLTESAAQFSERGEAHAANQLAEDVSGECLFVCFSLIYNNVRINIAMYERATSTVLADNALLHFAYADYEEARVRYKKCEQIYKKFIDNKPVDPTLVRLSF